MMHADVNSKRLWRWRKRQAEADAEAIEKWARSGFMASSFDDEDGD
jgi:hypothetical protein